MGKEYVGIDLHRRRSVIYRMDEAGEKIDCVRINNDPVWFAQEVGKAPKGSHVVIEATYGWYWAVDLLQEHGYIVHLSNPHGNDWGHRRVKNDERDARDLADLLRLGRLAEAWIAPPPVRELRELVRFRHKLCNLRTGVKAQAHAVMAKNGILPVRGDMWGESGTTQFDASSFPMPSTIAWPCCVPSSKPMTRRSSGSTGLSARRARTTPATTPFRPSTAWGR